MELQNTLYAGRVNVHGSYTCYYMVRFAETLFSAAGSLIDRRARRQSDQ